MAARNFSLARFGTVDETTATGLYVGEVSWSYKADKVDLKNHIGSTVGFTLADDQTGVKLSGAVTTKTAGMTPALASVLTLLNSSNDTLAANSKGLFSTPIANAGVVVIGAELKRASSEFETGDLDAVYHPGAVTNAPVSLT